MSKYKTLLNKEKLDKFLKWYDKWIAREELLKEDITIICDIIESLFKHIHCQESKMADLVKMVRLINVSVGDLRKDVESLRRLKKKPARRI